MAKPPKNRVREYRLLKRMSEEELAGIAKLSTAQLKRVEQGVEAVTVLRATWIARALSMPVHMIFPTVELPLKRARSKVDTTSPYEVLTHGPTLKAMTEGGLISDSMDAVLSIRMRHGVYRKLNVATGHTDQLWHRMQDGGDDWFIILDADGRRYAINPLHLLCAQLLFDLEVEEPKPADAEHGYELEVVFADNGEAVKFRVEADLEDLDAEDPDFVDVQIQDVFHTLSHFTTGERVTFQDMDEEPVSLRVEDIMLLSVPLECVEISLQPELPSEDPDDDDDGVSEGSAA